MRPRQSIFPVVLALALVGFWDCGKKAPPVLPQSTVLRVDGLTGTWNKGAVTLDGEIVAQKGQLKDPPQVSGCRVLYVWYALEAPPCEGCPIDYTAQRDMRGGFISGERFAGQVPGIEKTGIYYFAVRLRGPQGQLGPVSNRARVEVDELRPRIEY